MSNFSKLGLFLCLSFYAVSLAMITVASEYALFNYTLLGIAGTFTLVLLILNRVSLFKFLKTKLFKNILSNALTLFLSVCILGMINYFTYKNDYSIDFTKAKFHSLSDQSDRVIKELCNSNEPFKMTLFAKRADWGRFLKLLRLYKNSCKSVTLNAIDVEKNPALVSINSVKENGTLVIEFKSKKYKVVASTEQVVTTLISKILNPKIYNLYYIVGHNETSFLDVSPMGYSLLKESIENTNYILKPLELHNGIPSDASGVLLLNPQLSFLDKEISFLENYIKDGGGLITAFSPQFSENNLQNLYDFFEKLGIRFVNGLVLDRLSAGQGAQASIPIVNSYNSTHSITKDLKGRTLFPLSGYFKTLEDSVIKWEVLAESTAFPASWGEKTFTEVKSGKATFNQEFDDKGPLSLFVTGEIGKSRIAMLSSSSFIANQYQGHANNFNMFLNTISWIINDESSISVNRPNLQKNLVYLSDIQFSLIFYFAILLFPFIFFVIGIFVYKKKMSR
jgi:ABC-type uncharacterized transport system involved in gliding motility auxiliary subunit